jgi:phosphoglycolate phosphatase (TIGR01487 family)
VLKAVVTDVDGTITNSRRRINTTAIECIRTLVDGGIEVIIASGNTVCFMDGLCKMIGTNGTIIGENGGVYRHTFDGTLHIAGDQKACWNAFDTLTAHFSAQSTDLVLYSPDYRFADVAFARNVDPDEVRDVIREHHHPVRVLDTGFAIHLQALGVNKGTALSKLAGIMELSPAEILAVGDSENDIEMIRAAGIGVAVANSTEALCAAADYVSEKKYGDGFVDAVKKYYADFFSR